MTKIQNKINLNPLLVLLVFISLMGNILLLIDRFVPVTNLNILANPRTEVMNRIQNDFVGDQPNAQAKETGQIKGLVESLNDPYSEYLAKSDATNFQDEINERYQGIGVRFKITDNKAQITKVLDNSPAQAAGLQEKDIILKVDDTDMSDKSLDQIAAKVRGASGSQVKLTVSRDGKEQEFNLTRSPVQSELVNLEFKDNAAVISLTSFGDGLDAKMHDTAVKIQTRQKACDEGAKDSCVAKVILDLRSNTGGLLDQAVNVSSYFLPANSTILYEKTRQETTSEKTTAKDPDLSRYPLYILTDKYTASSSEVVAAAIKENRDIKLVGQKTFGKGVVQKLYPLSNGDTLKLTIAEWLTPKQNHINKVGIEPDITVKEQDDALDVALKQ